MPPGATAWSESTITWPTPVHSMIDVGIEADAGGAARVIRGAQRAHELGLGSRLHAIEDVHVQPALGADEGRQQPDRPRAGDEHGSRLPVRALADQAHLLPRLGDDGGRLEEHAEQAERAVHLHRVLRLDAPPLGHEAVDLLDAALGVLAVAAHVPFADGAIGARHGIRPADDADDEVPLPQRAAPAWIEDPAQRLVPEHQAGLAGRRPPVLARRRSRRRSRRHPRRRPRPARSRRSHPARGCLRGARFRA